MTDDEILKLDYKIKFFLNNITDIKNAWHSLNNYREKLKLWFFSIWLGTIVIFLKEESFNTIYLPLSLIFETIFFYTLEIFYYRDSARRIKRIKKIEKWMMTASNQEILDHPGPLSLLVENHSDIKLTHGFLYAIKNKTIGFPYWYIFCLSLLIYCIQIYN